MTAGVLPAPARTVSSRDGRKPRPVGRRLTPAPVEFCRVVLSVVAAQRVADEQVSLLGADAAASAAELDDLVERLAVRLGRQGVMRIRPVESYLPEKAFAPLDWDIAPGTSATPSRRPRMPPRPFRLFPPTELRVIVSPSYDRDGRPVSLATLRDGAMRNGAIRDGAMRAVVHAVGPERIAGQWWTGHDKSRDYFDIELPDGRRWWVFRVNETGRWFWQGEY
jgi:protein ImuB